MRVKSSVMPGFGSLCQGERQNITYPGTRNNKLGIGWIMKNQADYSQYECPYSHIEKECGHELNGPEGYKDVHGIWCSCGFCGPVFSLDPEMLKLKKKGTKTDTSLEIVSGEPSTDFWDDINSIDGLSSGDDIHNVLYSIGCKMQELESEIEKLIQ